jgi:superfamily II DNA or RNA helicase
VYAAQLCQQRLEAYRAAPHDTSEHYETEQAVLAGGYGYRQILELVQNAADAILEEAETGSMGSGRIEIMLSGGTLYAANTGAPVDRDGVKALLNAHSSAKRANQIGRFGLGFKSLLRLGGKIGIYSRTVSMEFDPERCRNDIRQALKLPSDAPVPGMRLAWTCSRDGAGAHDPWLPGYHWATTVVRCSIGDPNVVLGIAAEIRNLPAEFLLFLPVDVDMLLDDGQGNVRRLSRRRSGSDMILLDGETEHPWRVMERQVAMDDPMALEDATHVHRRTDVPVSWAMPLGQRRESTGYFWAFFPTSTPTYLAGILNAPWKLNSDRTSIIRGPWNDYIMRSAAEMVVDALPGLAAIDDRGRPLDAYPRDLDGKDEVATVLVEHVWKLLAERGRLPAADGEFRLATELSRHPSDDTTLAARWSRLSDGAARHRLVHPSCLAGRNRPSRLNALAERLEKQATADLPLLGRADHHSVPETLPGARLSRLSLEDWFAQVATPDPAGAVPVIALAGDAAKARDIQRSAEQVRQLRIIPTSMGQICGAPEVFIQPAGAPPQSEFQVVHPTLLDDDSTRKVLTEVLGVRSLDDAGWLKMLDIALRDARDTGAFYRDRSQTTSRWLRVWTTLRSAPDAIRTRAIDLHAETLMVRCQDGEWYTRDDVLLPGRILEAGDDTGILVDPGTHGQDEPLFKALGVSDVPRDAWHEIRTDWSSASARTRRIVSSYLEWCRSGYRGELRQDQRPQEHLLHVLHKIAVPAGWSLLLHLSGPPLARLTRKLLAALPGHDLKLVSLGHSTQEKKYPVIKISHPVVWALEKFGMLDVAEHLIPLQLVLDRLHERALHLIPDWDHIRPSLELAARSRSSHPSVDAQPDILWRSLLAAASEHRGNFEELRSVWAAAAREGVAPRHVPTPHGVLPLVQIHLTEDLALAEIANTAGLPSIATDAGVIEAWLTHGARRLEDNLTPVWAGILGPTLPLHNVVPEISSVLDESSRIRAVARICSGLALDIAGRRQPLPCLVHDRQLLIDPDAMSKLSWRERVAAVLRSAGASGWLSLSPEKALEQITVAGVEARRAAVARGTSIAERLLLAVGNDPAVITATFDDATRSALPHDAVALTVARLALAVHGPAVLSLLRGALEHQGLSPPSRWSTDEAREFVVAIGFDPGFAASPHRKRSPEVMVSGPTALPPLHDYQQGILDSLGELISSSGRRRAVVSLPTGAGKTRVVAQAAVKFVLAPAALRPPVLWVAQSDELCEQAVQCFRQIWANCGAEGIALRIVRLWGGQPSPRPSGPGEPTVIIASIQTLDSRLGTEALAWLTRPGLLVLDECHHALTPSYSGLLRWVDADSRVGAAREDEPPIVGLSATPFRGYDEEESRRLARRFDSRWFPHDQEDLYTSLRRRGVLARAEYEALPYDEEFVLTPAEIARIQRFSEFPDDAAERLGRVEARNAIIVDRIRDSSEQSILLFANSVSHAKHLAALLHLADIQAAAVTGETDRAARQYFIRCFQEGRIRVLCNHSVLTTGFDAPRTDMILISRPVFSPVLYMQMVGRGLRGPLNGGKEQCRIVTVQDNIMQFADRLAYHFCAPYFTEQQISIPEQSSAAPGSDEEEDHPTSDSPRMTNTEMSTAVSQMTEGTEEQQSVIGANVEMRDNVLWISHIRGDANLSQELEALPQGAVIGLAVDGISGWWEKMQDQPDGRPTPGLKPLGETKASWAASLQRQRGMLVSVSVVGRPARR